MSVCAIRFKLYTQTASRATVGAPGGRHADAASLFVAKAVDMLQAGRRSMSLAIRLCVHNVYNLSESAVTGDREAHSLDCGSAAVRERAVSFGTRRAAPRARAAGSRPTASQGETS